MSKHYKSANRILRLLESRDIGQQETHPSTALAKMANQYVAHNASSQSPVDQSPLTKKSYRFNHCNMQHQAMAARWSLNNGKIGNVDTRVAENLIPSPKTKQQDFRLANF